jgi:hypothetical protein
MFFERLFKKLESPWNMLWKKGEKQDKFVIYLLSIEVFVIILIVGIAKIDLMVKVNLAVALGTISMALAIVYIEIIKPWLQKPKIKIEFRNEAPFCRDCIIGKAVVAGKLRYQYGYFIRLRIRNIGGSLSKNLRGKLVEVTKPNGELDADFDPLFLHWTTIEKRQREIDPWANYLDPLDLNSTEFDYLDIFNLLEGRESEERPIEIIHTPHERGCRKYLEMSQVKNTFKITIYGENIEPVTEIYKLKWDGKNYNEIKMYKTK